MNMGFILLKYDLAWSTSPTRVQGSPIQYFSLGAEF